jgi:hypothetical protein
MQHARKGHGLSLVRPIGYATGGWHVLWFLLHVAAVYGITRFCAPWLAGWARASIPPWQSPTSSGSFELLFSHILAFSFVPAFGVGLMNARFKHRVAQFVWLVPTAILADKLLTFPGPSFFHGQFSAAFHQYFGGGFQIADFRDSHDFWTTLGPTSDMTRGMAQLNFTAPFYAGVAYSVASWITQRTNLSKKVSERVKHRERIDV